jgi:malonyl-CoA O-methyltransferase
VADLDKERVRRSFERAATTYDAHARVQTELAEELAVRIVDPPHSILELGSGTGTLTALLRARFPSARIVAVDFAPAMAARTHERVPDAEVLVADIETLEPVERFDLAVSSATIQWLARPERTLSRLAAASDRLLLGTFGPRTFWELDAVFAELGLDRGFPLRSAAEWQALLPGGAVAATRERTVEYESCAAFLHAVRAVGASAGGGRVSAAALTEVMRRYDERFARPDGVRATYELVVLDALTHGH